MLKDSFGRVHDYLRISLTDKCNLRCHYCMPENVCFLPQKSLLTKDEILEVAEVFVSDFGVNKIRLTGGEPLMRKDTEEIIESLSKLPVELVITTNGVLLDQFFPLFKKIGLQSINVSLDSLNPIKNRQITRRNYFERVEQNLRIGLDLGFNIKVNMVVMRGINDDEIQNFVNWTKDEPIHVRFIEFMPFDGNNWNWDKVVSFKEILDEIEGVHSIRKLEDKPNGTSKAYQVEGYEGTFAVISSITLPFCGGCNRIRLTADGRLKSCLFSQYETDLLSPLREGIDFRSFVKQCVQEKSAERGGLVEFYHRNAKSEYEKGRCMTSIGG